MVRAPVLSVIVNLLGEDRGGRMGGLDQRLAQPRTARPGLAAFALAPLWVVPRAWYDWLTTRTLICTPHVKGANGLAEPCDRM